MYIYIYINIYIYIYTHTHVYIYTYLYINYNAYTYLYTNTYIRIQAADNEGRLVIARLSSSLPLVMSACLILGIMWLIGAIVAIQAEILESQYPSILGNVTCV